MKYRNLWCILIWFNCLLPSSWLLQLSEHIGEYDTLDYNKHELLEKHHRTRRSVYDKVITLPIKALGKKFMLNLYPDSETFHPYTDFETRGDSGYLDTSHLFIGHVDGHPGSKVFGSIIGGVFQGRIELSDGDKYQVEKVEFYKENPDLQKNPDVHSVIYHDKSVDIDGFYRKLRERRSTDNEGTCGNDHGSTREWMKRVQRSIVEEDSHQETFEHTPGDNPYLRRKRDASTHRTCNLYLQGDPELWKYYKDRFDAQTTPEQLQEEITAMFQQHVQAVNGIYKDTTFKASDSSTAYRNYQFRVDRVKINESCSSTFVPGNPYCNPAIDASNLLNLNSLNNHDQFCLAYIFTYRDFDGGTLGLAWVAEPGKVGGVCSKNKEVRDGVSTRFRSLNTGIVTLNNYRKRVPARVSYITLAHELGHNFGSNTMTKPECNVSHCIVELAERGGVCSEYAVFSSSTGRKEGKSLNTGIVTLENYQKPVPQRVSFNTFAHELGHNFGAQHDPEGDPRDCTPYTERSDPKGNYIMFASATTGLKENNNKFSECSKQSIGKVLNSVVNNQNGHRACFLQSTGPWCGNQIREDTEQCDCGYKSDCEGDDCCPCCNPRPDNPTTADADTYCKLKPGKLCDPSQGPCCTATCGFVAAAQNITCQPATECSYRSSCDGSNSATCPTAVPKPDRDTLCNNNTQFCEQGECQKSICELMTSDKTGLPWQECSTSRTDKDETLLCYISCSDDNGTTCYSSKSLNDPNFPVKFANLLKNTANVTSGIPMPAGSSCDKEKGFCDHFQKCRMINVKGPLARLKDLLFSESSLNKIRMWVTEYWWGVALALVGLIILMGLIVKFCAVHTPSSNPNRKPARQLSHTLTLRRRRQQQQQQQPPQRQSNPGHRQTQAQSGPPPSYDMIETERPQRSSKTPQDRRQQYELRNSDNRRR